MPTSYVDDLGGGGGGGGALSAPVPVPAAGSGPMAIKQPGGAAAKKAAVGAVKAAAKPMSASLGGDGGAMGDDWRREMETLRDMFMRERERNNALEEQLARMRADLDAQADELVANAEAVGDLQALRKDVERLRVAVARLGKGADESLERMVAETAINRLEEEIEGATR